jgi:hypothetical protein
LALRPRPHDVKAGFAQAVDAHRRMVEGGTPLDRVAPHFERISDGGSA